ncbi:MAG: hypothetical protein MUF49_18350 [Oculatellaceae cyanobacterium Prado106]|nr:hypothetical protein [Oculatellaceae cyanobacterium Prado106]
MNPSPHPFSPRQVSAFGTACLAVLALLVTVPAQESRPQSEMPNRFLVALDWLKGDLQ